MRVIQLQISLEQFKSRMPGFIPSFKKFERIESRTNDDVDERFLVPGNTVSYSEDLILSRYPNANYNMFPSDVMYKDNGNVYTYPNISSIYHFFKRYYGLLRSSCCGNRRQYNNAVEYYENEAQYLDRTREYYEELDRTAVEYGADTETGECKFYEDIMYDLMREMEIPETFSENWNTKTLTVPDLIDWRNWFNTTSENCKNGNADCCECEKYDRLGGDGMRDWLNSVEIDAEMRNFESLNEACINIPLSISQKIDELGEYSILSPSWEPGMDYTPHKEYTSGTGTIVVFNDKIYTINKEKKGFRYDNNFKEIQFERQHWTLYKTEEGRIKPEYRKYAYNGMDIFVVPEDEASIPEEYRLTAENIADKYQVRRGRFAYIHGKTHETFISDYIIYKSPNNGILDGKAFTVEYENGIPYVSIKGRRYFAFADEKGEYAFNFGYVKCGKTDPEYDCKIINDGEFVRMGDMAYPVVDEKIEIGKEKFVIFDGISDVEGYGEVFVNGDTAIEFEFSYEDGKGMQNQIESDVLGKKYDSLDDVDNKILGYMVGNDDILYVIQPYDVYDANIIEGDADSKLEHFMDVKRSYDDYGNELPGRFRIEESEYPCPQENETLDLYYHTGQMRNVEVLWSDEKGTEELISCDFMERMSFYYKHSDGTIEEDTRVTIEYDTPGKKDNRGFIKECEDKYLEYIENNTQQTYSLLDTMYCEFTYSFGRVMERRKSPRGADIIIEDDKFPGIVYKEEAVVEKETMMYRFSSGDDYPIVYYNIIRPENGIVLEDYMGDIVNVNLAHFRIDKSSTWGEYLDKYNGGVRTPLFREEYKFGMVLPQNLNVDIYINRGNAQSNDRHLRLMETRSMEAFEQYGNGYWKINNAN